MSTEQEKLNAFQEELGSAHTGAVTGAELAFDDVVWTVDRRKTIDVLTWLKGRGFDLLLDINGVDGLHLGRAERFEVVYILYSIADNLRLTKAGQRLITHGVRHTMAGSRLIAHGVWLSAEGATDI